MVIPSFTGKRHAGSIAAVRAKARAAGRTTYLGLPCVTCGCQERRVTTSACVRCPRPQRRRSASRELTKDDLPLAFELWQDGMSFREIASKFSVPARKVAAALYAEEERRYMERVSLETD